MNYIRTAEELRGGFGEVFPPLPECLLGAIEAEPLSKARRKIRSRYNPRRSGGNAQESFAEDESSRAAARGV